MSDWLIWFGLYLLAGAVFIVSVRLIVKLQERAKAKKDDLVADLLSASRSLEASKSWFDRSAELAAYALIVLIWPCLPLVLGIDHLIKKFRKEPDMFAEPKVVEGKTTLEEGCWPEHLLELVDVAEVAQAHKVYDPLNRVPSLPFGFLNEAWEEFVSQVQTGDEVRRFEIKEGQPCGLYGYESGEDVAGYAILRDGIVVAQFQYEFD